MRNLDLIYFYYSQIQKLITAKNHHPLDVSKKFTLKSLSYDYFTKIQYSVIYEMPIKRWKRKAFSTYEIKFIFVRS